MASAEINERTSTAIVGGVQIFATLAATALLDRVGRRPLLLTSGGQYLTLPIVMTWQEMFTAIVLYLSAVFMAASMFALGCFSYFKDGVWEAQSTCNWLPLFLLMANVAGSSIGWV